jgi:putative hydrolase of the HAD superfamily
MASPRSDEPAGSTAGRRAAPNPAQPPRGVAKARSDEPGGSTAGRRAAPSPAQPPRGVAKARSDEPGGSTIWLFDLDNTLHNASRSVFRELNAQMSAYIVRELGVSAEEADALRRSYWRRYGATLLGLMRHHGVRAAHFLHHTHLLPGLEARLHGHAHDFDALLRLPGRKVVLTNAPAAYTARVLGVLGIARAFDDVFSIEDMAMFGHLRPKPDARMLHRMTVRLRVPASRCVLVEDTLEHQKAARRVGMRTVWMQRWTRAAGPAGTVAAGRTTLTPGYVDHRVRSLSALCRLPRHRHARTPETGPWG